MLKKTMVAFVCVWPTFCLANTDLETLVEGRVQAKVDKISPEHLESLDVTEAALSDQIKKEVVKRLVKRIAKDIVSEIYQARQQN